MVDDFAAEERVVRSGDEERVVRGERVEGGDDAGLKGAAALWQEMGSEGR